jgi:methanogenic corrinoid protein MtbC1
MGPRMMADLAEMAGFDVTYLGPAAASSVADAVRERKPDVIGLSATLVSHLGHVGAMIAELRQALGPSCPPILVGGRAFALAPEAWRQLGADAYAPTSEAAMAYMGEVRAS